MCKMAVPGGWASVIDRSSFPLARSHIVICKQVVLSIKYLLSRDLSITLCDGTSLSFYIQHKNN